MKIYHFKLALTGLAALLLSACASLPEQLTSQSESVVTDYTIWTQADPAQKGEVRLGGVIASTKNLTDKTRLEIVNLPIDDAGRPSLTSEPQGRFVAYVKGFLDPVTFGEGRLITLVGTTAEPESGKVGDFEHQFPVMNANGYYLWRVTERVVIDDTGPYMFPCRNFYCRHFDDFPRDGRVIQEVK
ncbi:Slp family lipoprotein [Vibrio fluvialis]|jgi:outer membrane lipoprotein|uniref:Outer membrane lipoprotein Slp n=1 Tax=Vibrio fluvialis TaxID=676 RepID=A0AAX2LPT8_VIBFL|nr:MULTISPECIES: Slp family lipoprotein [Vibrio]TNF14867.1 MAG: Slp family lipoprotein [Vibrionaceae bacterium]HDM8033013.1 Slp family lipoprotein [Vibrio fluvialis clinical-1]AMF94896.1 starvation-inducible protein [Vibrio fluvialis]EKO3371297.1 Slp family lipoprotein [Vibrio fluvialis]EKO3378271.1 Slp family lipoprotein [Vibrio fluvialis]